MGILSRFGFRGFRGHRGRRGFSESADEPDETHSLIRTRYEDPRIAEAEQGAAQDIAAVEQDDKYFDPDSPAQKDEGI